MRLVYFIGRLVPSMLLNNMPFIKQCQPFTGILNNSSLWIWSIKMFVKGSTFSSFGMCTFSPLLKLDITMDIFQHVFLRFWGNYLEK